MRIFLSTTVMAVALTGCLNQGQHEQTGNTLETIEPKLIEEGRYAEAANRYLALAQTTQGDASQALTLKAVRLLLDIGQTDRASSLMDDLTKQAIADRLIPKHHLLAAELALLQGAPHRTLEWLANLSTNQIDREFASTLHQLRARAYADTGQFLGAVRERIRLNTVLVDATRQAANHSALWDALARVDRDERKQAMAAATGTLGGWLNLAAIFEERRSPAALERALTKWRAAFPAHPADTEIATTMRVVVRESVRQPTHIALLLPLHGDFAEAARAVRDGFLVAWYTDTPDSQRPIIEIHDTSIEAIDIIYARAVEAGADFVVGPLRRGPVTSLACSNALLVTTLALNGVDEIVVSDEETTPACDPKRAVPELYHFDLTPEAEARQVAERARSDGFWKALALTQEGAWGDRVYRAFADEWRQRGGILLEHHTLPTTAGDIGQSIMAALAVSRSRERARRIRTILNRKIEHEPRRRQDIDFIFMAAFPDYARQLKPQLAFHYGAELPIYSASHAYSGVHDPTHDRDLDGVVLGDMPWLIAPTESDRALRAQLSAALPERGTRSPRLYAFGADAYRLATGLRRITSGEFASLDGHTGKLSIGTGHRITRRLTWARFVEGLPKPYNPDTLDVEPAPNQ